MAALRDRRHEQVAQCLAVMKTPAAASREAGYKDGTSFEANARKRANRKDIRARVAELQTAQAELVEIDAAWIRHKLSRIAGVEFDSSEIEPSQAVAALNLLTKMTPGALAPTKLEATGADGGPMLLGEISDADRIKALSAFLARHKTTSVPFDEGSGA